MPAETLGHARPNGSDPYPFQVIQVRALEQEPGSLAKPPVRRVHFPVTRGPHELRTLSEPLRDARHCYEPRHSPSTMTRGAFAKRVV